MLLPDAHLATQWRPDLLRGVMVITGKFRDGSPLLAIPHYARQNRTTSTNEKEEGEPGADSRRRGTRSIVWIRDE